ncbi:hypothetical protein R1sor_010404 [Riccia sorocarpa]|uniref:Uncharacterized protein n=1 Tax=Riccia sorocarpa TaxID=122646 RepID=A0ABD3HY09_9MARC
MDETHSEAAFSLEVKDTRKHGAGVGCQEVGQLQCHLQEETIHDLSALETDVLSDSVVTSDSGTEMDHDHASGNEVREHTASFSLQLLQQEAQVYIDEQQDPMKVESGESQFMLSLSESEQKHEPSTECESQDFVSSVNDGQNPLFEQGQQISKLEAELSSMRQYVDCVQKESSQLEKAKNLAEAKALELQAELEAARSVIKESQAMGEVKDEQEARLREALIQLELQSRFLDSGTDEADRAGELIDLQRSCHELKMKLSEKETAFRSLRDAHEQLRSSHKKKEEKMRQEKDEVINALEASELQCEEQRVRLRELENEVSRFKTQASNMEKKCAKAESKAKESSSVLEELQSRLDETITELFELKNSNTQVDSMRIRLQECERALSHEKSQRAKAEKSLKALKHREEVLEEAEQEHKELQERFKWRNEQFQSLEEAHSKLRSEYGLKKREWESEKGGMLSEIDSLQSALDSKERLLVQVQNQLQMVHQALAHEETRRKALEVQAEDASRGLEQATADCEAARSAVDTLREQMSSEIGSLRDALGTKDRQFKELEIKHSQMEQEHIELKAFEKEYQEWMATHGDQQKLVTDMKERMASLVESHDTLRARVKEQEKGFEKERKEMVKALDQATENLTAREEAMKQLDEEMERLKAALEHLKAHRSELDSQLTVTREQLEKACEDAAEAKLALSSIEKDSHSEKAMLLQTVNGKDKIIQELKTQVSLLNQTIAELNTHEEKWREMQNECQILKDRLAHGETERREMERIHRSLIQRTSDQQKEWLAEREKLVSDLQRFETAARDKDQQLTEAQYTVQRHREVISKLESRCASIDSEIAEHVMQAQKATEMLALEKQQLDIVKKEARNETESLAAALSHKELSLQKLTEQIKELESELGQKTGELADQNERVAWLEKRVQDTNELFCNMEEHISSLKTQAARDAQELKVLEESRNSLAEQLRKTQEEHQALRTEMEKQLEMLQREQSTSASRLKAVTCKLEEERGQKELLLKDLDAKEGNLTKLQEERKSLLVEKAALQQAVQVLEAKKRLLLQEVETSRNSINQLCNQVETAEASLASKSVEVKELQAKIQNAHKADSQLRAAEEKIKELEDYLNAAKVIAQDKEEKLVASEWAVQQLALDVNKAKNALHLKEREESLLKDSLEDLERQLRAKEGELIEMECYLEEAVSARKFMQHEVEKLHQRMEDLDRGAAEWKRKESEMTAQLEVVGSALEEKRDALVASELEVKRGNDMRQVMEGAIESLKSQLTEEQKALSARQIEMNKLCEDLEKTKEAASTSAELVKDLQGKLQQLEQSSEDRLTKYQTTVTELQRELSASCLQLEKYEKQTNVLREESSRYREKCEALLDLTGRKDKALEAIESELQDLQSAYERQGKLGEKRDQELRFAKDQIQHLEERQTALFESFTKLQGQADELERSNVDLEGTVSNLTRRLDKANTSSALKSEEIDGLKAQVMQLKAIAAEEGESQALLAKLSEDLQASSRGVQEREARIRVLSSSLEATQSQLHDIQGVIAGKDSDMESLQESLVQAVRRAEESETELRKIEEEMKLAQNELAEKSQAISSYVSIISDLKTENEEWKGKSEVSSRERTCLKHELETTTARAVESEEAVLQARLSLDQSQLELQEKTNTIAEHLALIEELQEQLAVWNEKTQRTTVEQRELESAVALAEAKAADMQQAVKRAEEEVNKYSRTVSDLQAELSELRVRETANHEEGLRLKEELQLNQSKAEQNQVHIFELQKTLETSEKQVKEKAEELSEFILQTSKMEAELFDWKQKVAAADAEVAALKEKLETADGKGGEQDEEVTRMRETIMVMKVGLEEEQSKAQSVIAQLEMDLMEERRKVSESYGLLTGLQTCAEDWKNKAEAASKEGERLKSELAEALNTLSELTLQVEGHHMREESLAEQNQSLQEEVIARKEHMQTFLVQLQQSQKSEKNLLAQLKLEYQALSKETENGGGGFHCAFEVDAGLGSSQVPNPALHCSPGWIEKRLTFAESQDSADDGPLVLANEALEKELVLLRHQAEESQQEAQKLAVRLETALSNLATKNQIIMQVHEEISGLRAVVRALELEKLAQENDASAKQLPPGGNPGDEQDYTSTIISKPTNQEELNHYLELCDSLVRKNVRLEKQLDGLQRKNRGLQKQLEGLQCPDKAAGEKQRKPLDPVLSNSPEPEVQRKVNAKPLLLDRQASLQDISGGKILGELTRMRAPQIMDKQPCQMGRRSAFSPAAEEIQANS